MSRMSSRNESWFGRKNSAAAETRSMNFSPPKSLLTRSAYFTTKNKKTKIERKTTAEWNFNHFCAHLLNILASVEIAFKRLSMAAFYDRSCLSPSPNDMASSGVSSAPVVDRSIVTN